MILPFVLVLIAAQPIPFTDAQLLVFLSEQGSQHTSNLYCFESDDKFDDLLYCPGGAD